MIPDWLKELCRVQLFQATILLKVNNIGTKPEGVHSCQTLLVYTILLVCQTVNVPLYQCAIELLVSAPFSQCAILLVFHIASVPVCQTANVPLYQCAILLVYHYASVIEPVC